MSKCEFCGVEAGLLRKHPRECKDRHDSAESEIRTEAKHVALAGGNLSDLAARAALSARANYIDERALRSLYLVSWEEAVESALDDDVLSSEEESALVKYKNHFGFAQGDLDNSGAFSRVAKAGIIRDLLEDKLPDRVTVHGQVPFNLQKSENLLWFFNNVQYLEERSRTTYQGGSQGASIRVAKGVYYRVGSFKGNPVITSQMVHVGTGHLGITQKHIYFASSDKALRVPYAKIVAFRPYADGVGIQRDAASARPQVFITGDGWFTYNLVSNLARIAAA
jgi:hypothetical protein